MGHNLSDQNVYPYTCSYQQTPLILVGFLPAPIIVITILRLSVLERKGYLPFGCLFEEDAFSCHQEGFISLKKNHQSVKPIVSELDNA